jgi:hypothetical protein
VYVLPFPLIVRDATAPETVKWQEAHFIPWPLAS